MNISINPKAVLHATSPKAAGKDKAARDLKSLRESCREFEAIFVQQMYQAMRKNVPNDGLLPRDNATQIYQDMLDTQMARETAKGKGIGLGEAMYNPVSYTHLTLPTSDLV
jgi:flagellar protein FlgJ